VSRAGAFPWVRGSSLTDSTIPICKASDYRSGDTEGLTQGDAHFGPGHGGSHQHSSGYSAGVSGNRTLPRTRSLPQLCVIVLTPKSPKFIVD
jgi:hypothetical protein